jgi:hypothetical protein
VGSGGATLRVLWVEECLGRPLRQEDFQRIEVPIEVVAQGHADSRMAPIALIGRHGDPADEHASQRPWTAHRIPLELPISKLLPDLREAPWYQPDLDAWQKVLRRFTGQEPASCQCPEVTRFEVQQAYERAARLWFGDRLNPGDFKSIFGVELAGPSRAVSPPKAAAASAGPTSEGDIGGVLKSFREELIAQAQP